MTPFGYSPSDHREFALVVRLIDWPQTLLVLFGEITAVQLVRNLILFVRACLAVVRGDGLRSLDVRLFPSRHAVGQPSDVRVLDSDRGRFLKVFDVFDRATVVVRRRKLAESELASTSL